MVLIGTRPNAVLWSRQIELVFSFVLTDDSTARFALHLVAATAIAVPMAWSLNGWVEEPAMRGRPRVVRAPPHAFSIDTLAARLSASCQRERSR